MSVVDKSIPADKSLTGVGGSCPTGSMETCTLSTDCIDGFGSEEDQPSREEDEIWGRLFPVGSSFTAIDLIKDQYTFGRGETCDYPFSSPVMMKHPCYQAYSKVHFRITREKTSTGDHVFLTDTSSNGTFVNGEKVGKSCKQVLNNNDEIALSMKKNKAFVYMDASANEDKDLPEELREKYTMSKTLGRGACGEVKLAFIKGTCQTVAIKIVQKKKFSMTSSKAMNPSNQVMNEVNILKSLNHPCIIAVKDVVDTQDTLYIVMELVEGGELFDRVVSVGHFDEPTAKLLFYQMVLGVKYLHDQDISHRDLKPENILLSSSDTNDTLVKVTDFGLSKFVDANTMLKTFCGTPNYLAPEILVTAGKGAYTKAIDCWSLGVILFICLVGYPPFSDERSDMELPKQITGGHYTHYMITEDWKHVSKNAKDLVKKLLCVDPKQRISLDQAVSHPWFQDDDVKNKVNDIFQTADYEDAMLPPQTIPKKRKAEGGDSPIKKKVSLQPQDHI